MNIEIYQSKYLNNEVLIEINEKSNNNLDADIELIILYFENPKLTGGCDTIATRYDKITKKLVLNYKFYEIKKLILEKKYFNYQDYSFVSLNIDPSYMDIQKKSLNNVFILHNINTEEDATVVELYVEYLVDNSSTENEIIDIQKSSLFDKTLFIRLKNEFNLINLKKRLNKKPKLRENFIQLYAGYETNILFGRIVGSEIDDEIVFDYLDEKFNETTKSFWQLLFKTKNKNKFIIVKFKNEDYLETCLEEKKHLISRDSFLTFEKCFNFQFFDSYIDENFHSLNQNIDLDEDQGLGFNPEILTKLKLINTSYFSENNDTIKLIDDVLVESQSLSTLPLPTPPIVLLSPAAMSATSVDSEDDEKPYYYELSEKHELHDILINSSKVLQDFSSYIEPDTVIVKNGFVHVTSNSFNIEYVDWAASIDEKIDEFWGENFDFIVS